MNAARTLGPALVQQHFTNWWTYWVARNIGGLPGAFAYKTFWFNGSQARVLVRR